MNDTSNFHQICPKWFLLSKVVKREPNGRHGVEHFHHFVRKIAAELEFVAIL